MNKILEISIPSKTFLLGEYLVLKHGKALVMTTEPRFTLNISANDDNHCGIDPHSPAGKFIQKNCNDFSNYQVDFIDPHQALGGFGASTAMFLGSYVAKELLQKKSIDINLLHLLTTYRKLAWTGQGFAPSGADLISQFYGGLNCIDTFEPSQKTIAWPFPDLSLYLVRTHHKVPTHTHLNSLEEFNADTLLQIYQEAEKTFMTADSSTFCDMINAYQKELFAQSLVALTTKELLEKLNQPFIKAIKGCGALGADVLAIAINKEDEKQFLNYATEKKLTIISSEKTIAEGLHYNIGNSYDMES